MDKIEAARTWLDLKLMRDMRSNQMNFWENISIKRKAEEQVVKRAW